MQPFVSLQRLQNLRFIPKYLHSQPPPHVLNMTSDLFPSVIAAFSFAFSRIYHPYHTRIMTVQTTERTEAGTNHNSVSSKCCTCSMFEFWRQKHVKQIVYVFLY